MNNPFDKLQQQLFLESLKMFKTIYSNLAKVAQKNIMGLIALKHSIDMQKEFFYNTFGEKEIERFDEELAELTIHFNPDIYLKKLEESLLCIKISKKSYLSKQFGTKEICGKYLGLIDDVKTKIKSEKTNEYEEVKSHISFSFVYPKGTITNIAYIDLADMNEF